MWFFGRGLCIPRMKVVQQFPHSPTNIIGKHEYRPTISPGGGTLPTPIEDRGEILNMSHS